MTSPSTNGSCQPPHSRSRRKSDRAADESTRDCSGRRPSVRSRAIGSHPAPAPTRKQQRAPAIAEMASRCQAREPGVCGGGTRTLHHARPPRCPRVRTLRADCLPRRNPRPRCPPSLFLAEREGFEPWSVPPQALTRKSSNSRRGWLRQSPRTPGTSGVPLDSPATSAATASRVDPLGNRRNVTACHVPEQSIVGNRRRMSRKGVSVPDLVTVPAISSHAVELIGADEETGPHDGSAR
jgi:hypothetical protein